jgi:hypothetical protein
MSTLFVPTTDKITSTLAKQDSLLHLLPTFEDEISVEERATMLLVRDLVRLGWRLKSNPKLHNSFELAPPNVYAKQVVRDAMAYARNEILEANALWIEKHLHLARRNLALGAKVLESNICPRIEVCKTEKSRNIFRLFRYYWSSPYSEYVGRRLRLLIRDDGIEGSPVIGIAALGSSIIHIPDRDKEIGWDKKIRTDRIIYMMDAYILGALPPYNYLLGGKLISYILASNEIRQLYKERYLDASTIIKGRKASDLALIVTTSLYGHNSSQYNRLKYNDSLLYLPIGETAGYGTLHISNETFNALRTLMEANGHIISYKFGSGANWRMRVIKKACEMMGLDSETILKHSFQRGLFAVPLAINWKAFLNGEDESPIYRDLPMNDLVDYWKERWLTMRRQNDLVVQQVKDFHPDKFQLSKSII